MKCPNCGSNHIEEGIVWGAREDGGRLGLEYKKFIFEGIAQMYSDLCVDCGEVVRTYIKDYNDKKWVKFTTEEE